MEIRKANKKDIEKIVELNAQLFNYHAKIDKYYKSDKEGINSFKKHLKEIISKRNYRIIVAEDKGKTVGFLVGRVDKPRPYAKPKKIGMLSTAFVCKNCRRSGIGKLMFNDFLEWCRKNKVKNIELSVDSRNEIGNGAWKKFGFKDFMKRMRLDL
ncbi:MAG TPA: GNAT family N-acetyltransferase [Candidatus Moranbacteria bacterium]|nr:GNAT family N-acetyltransferase [Candidatus Moranbacteria bacterium]HSA08298.1 GNAT family N-acetyltransferase [Candidatus Moranbacteria bacterium]